MTLFKMKNYFLLAAGLFVTTVLTSSVGHVFAQEIDARISTRETFVGLPVVLQLSVVNASSYERPQLPEIEGCDVRSAGSPSTSSQVTIINGRRSESRSVTMQYLITPQREGDFTIPPLKFKVDGREMKTEPFIFVVTKSETGDLLFAEIVGGKDKVFVGQPLDLILRIWIKPFRDREHDVTLSEAHMWQMMSNQTSWGGFEKQLEEMAQRNQRPAGREVLRDDGEGHQRSYYLYEIEGKVYPKRPGNIDTSDVRIVVNYPTKLAKSRDPFDDMLNSRRLGGSSILNRRRSDDFMSSPFGRRLAVAEARPIVAEAKVDATEVVAVPTIGRPFDYRGAVGQYRMVTEATPLSVEAGDPIRLTIGIIGTGPMELVQAPPLGEITELTDDFQVADQSLAGFVRDETKVFSTTIRPRREGIAEIPAIPFSYFDPDSETFVTVKSQPISIQVDKADSLSLDSIVGATKRNRDGKPDSQMESPIGMPDFSNRRTNDVLENVRAKSSGWSWTLFVFIPPLIWLAFLLVFRRQWIAKRMPSFRSAKAQCLLNLKRANSPQELADGIVILIAARTGKLSDESTTALGSLRASGCYDLANDVEEFFANCDDHRLTGARFSNRAETSIDEYRTSAIDLAERIDMTLKENKLSRVRHNKSKAASGTNRTGNRRNVQTNNIVGIFYLISISSFVAPAQAAFTIDDNANAIVLSQQQQATILNDASEIYATAMSVTKQESAQAKEGFSRAAEKYQLLVDSGISNPQLYLNLANAYLKSGTLGHAIANYERASALDPTDLQIKNNRDFAMAMVNSPEANESAEETFSFQSVWGEFRNANAQLANGIGPNTLRWILMVCSIIFWGMMTLRVSGLKFHVRKWAAAPLVLLVFSGISYGLLQLGEDTDQSGILVVDNIEVRPGDGLEFESVIELTSVEGQRVQILAMRESWVQIRTADGQSGWIEGEQVEIIDRGQRLRQGSPGNLTDRDR